MKKHFLICFIIFFVIKSISAQTQSGMAIYKVEMNDEAIEDLVESDTVSSDLSHFLKMQFEKRRKAVPFLSYKLYFNKEESLFENIDAMKGDNGMDLQSASRSIGIYGDFYVDLKNNEILNQLNFMDKYWLVGRDVSEFQWEITGETKTIQGYLCQKATTTYAPNFGKAGQITAWFSTEIPFQFGPMGFVGLPGLIVQLEKDFYTIYIHEIALDKQKRKISKTRRGKYLNFEEFLEKKKQWEFQMKMQHVRQRQ